MPTEANKLKIEFIATEKLVPYINNPKEHPPEQVAQIAASIQAFGFNDPIAIDEDNLIIEGHGRLLAAQQLGLVKVPTICLAHLSEAERKAYAIAHNKLTLNSGWNPDLLQIELDSLQALDFDNLILTGFSMEELEKLNLDQEDFLTPVLPVEADGEKKEISIQYENQYGVIVQCESEAQQERIFGELSEAGYNCKVVVVGKLPSKSAALISTATGRRGLSRYLTWNLAQISPCRRSFLLMNPIGQSASLWVRLAPAKRLLVAVSGQKRRSTISTRVGT
jgi:hypothetical protein